jgi:NAD(P)-dependent dehydrogenase (short-subunit alcohol dehydrogenase family)
MGTQELLNLTGKVAVVTGASRGIGQACGLYLARAGAKVVVNYRDQLEAAEKTLDEIRQNGSDGLVVQADVSKPGGAEALIRQAEAHFGRVDVLVSNVGVGSALNAEQLTEEEFLKVFHTNVLSHSSAVRAVLPSMKARGWGRIISIASVVGRSGKGFIGTSPAYAAAKGALISYNRSLARECGAHHITVNSVCPGWIDWPGKQRNVPPGLREQAVREMPMGRTGSAEDVAGAVLYLASDLASYVTGVSLDVNGGLYMA